MTSSMIPVVVTRKSLAPRSVAAVLVTTICKGWTTLTSMTTVQRTQTLTHEVNIAPAIGWARSDIAGLAGAVHTHLRPGAFGDSLAGGRDVPHEPVIEVPVRPQVLRHVRIVHRQHELLGVRGDAAEIERGIDAAARGVARVLRWNLLTLLEGGRRR